MLAWKRVKYLLRLSLIITICRPVGMLGISSEKQIYARAESFRTPFANCARRARAVRATIMDTVYQFIISGGF